MDSSYFSIIIFIIITVIYCFFGKANITLQSYTDNELNPESTSLLNLAIYFALVIGTQFIVNSIYVMNKCGGSAANNIGFVALNTFFPWIFLFGAVIACLIAFPGFKSAFSDIVGYFAVYGKANEILGSILLDPDIDKSINDSTASEEEKMNLKKSAQLILKICSNKSIIINQLTPENFMKGWNGLKFLMKDGGNSPDIENKQIELLKLVVFKDNIGEMMWYIYTGILLSSIISFRLASHGCEKTIEQLKENQQEYIQKEADIRKQQKINNANPLKL